MSKVVLDSSALLALLHNEPGAAIVANAIGEASMSTVNVAEAFAVFVRNGIPRERARSFIMRSGVNVESFDYPQAEEAGALVRETANLGLSLGDRACLALAMRLNVEVLTADAAWAKLKLPMSITVIR